ncbi:hypothetical protein BWD42_06580 [Sphingobacterium sp. CZ-UAM]|nr:hypothetical protein BWD42_06580 [Sphingobacterium sp. CZ-UAM]
MGPGFESQRDHKRKANRKIGFSCFNGIQDSNKGMATDHIFLFCLDIGKSCRCIMPHINIILFQHSSRSQPESMRDLLLSHLIVNQTSSR